MDLDFYKADRRMYEYVKLEIWLKELYKGYFVKKWNKPTKKGSSVKFRVLDDKNSFKDKLKEIEDYMNSLNDECNFGFHFETNKDSEKAD
jgi:hypothetical protein